ncbi:MAG: hypothetical protein CVU46_04490 [Chloroflexi bacterium HGW-Chloroflexi-8]|nr:MAG: hypothetical protein CVU46_04490 [Chloroflexi bacterium HGW-Chloroflexi-8]
MNSQKIVVFIINLPEHPGLLNWQIVSAAQKIRAFSSANLELVVIGNLDNSVLEKAKSYKFEKINVLNIPYTALLINSLFQSLAFFLKTINPQIVLFSESHFDLELAASCSIALNLPLITQVQSIQIKDNILFLSRTILGGKAKQAYKFESASGIFSFKTNAFSEPLEDSLDHDPEIVHVEIEETHSKIKILSIEECENILPIEHARIIVAGGHGLLNSPAQPPNGLSQIEADQWKLNQGLKLLQELANCLGGSVAVSRSLVDSGYAPYELQVGQTGKMVEPEIYIACGISGAIQHTIGMNKSKLIIAINNDENAPIFKIANYGVHADLYEIIPEWIKFRKEK